MLKRQLENNTIKFAKAKSNSGLPFDRSYRYDRCESNGNRDNNGNCCDYGRNKTETTSFTTVLCGIASERNSFLPTSRTHQLNSYSSTKPKLCLREIMSSKLQTCLQPNEDKESPLQINVGPAWSLGEGEVHCLASTGALRHGPSLSWCTGLELLLRHRSLVSYASGQY
ncbi:hypothetical protein CEXT_253301 [Caerostris extrusa]|uniref:Uncharacterized protein n=1 Tax=Caerostris extrusa TaxID=172846 RepID=A0AAV4TSU9_CAEEX|nr:hypothetical protein CEXT_253301 [Caerostris extrusa]